MRRLIVAALGFLLSCQVAGAQIYENSLSGAAAWARTDGLALCQKGSACTSSDSLKYGTLSQLNTYLNAEQVNCTNASGDIALIQTAVATGRPVHIIGTCKEDTGDTVITLSTDGQVIFGDGRTKTTITVNSVMTTALFNCTTGNGFTDTGPTIRDIGVIFAQANTASRASLTAFTPAFRFRDCPGARFQGVRVSQAMIGFDLRDQSGQTVLDDVEVSCLSVCIWTNGAADTIKIHKVHVWPYGPSLVEAGQGAGSYSGASNLSLLYNTLNPFCAVRTTSGTEGPIGLLDEQGFGGGEDLKVSDSLFLIGQSACFGTLGVSQVSISNTAFDTFAGVYAKNGRVRITTSYFGQLQGGANAIFNEGADVTCVDCTIYKATNANPAVYMDAGTTTIADSLFVMNAGTLAIEGETSGRLTATGNMINGTGGANPMICIGCSANGVVGIISGNQPTVAASSAATFIKVNADGFHRVIGNGSDTNWANVCPATQTNMRSANNGAATNATCN